ncbi:unnamed protein product [Acanthoscelides obtectus]|uniref:Uncharacterized protein n=1 Tax=Acanthoscelides obtectus TaxID=200917 RepID=A0A9P0QBU9_ACAOB|nr:unnamed protein product [Acanthoscelides obtectus]CAK1667897.1 hypothetical protein AOBTE_LOCUS26097 [Acanthoscelides obtectus]
MKEADLRTMWKQEFWQEGYLHEYFKVATYEDATPNRDMTDLQKKNKLIVLH